MEASLFSPIHFAILVLYTQPLLGLAAGTPAGLLIPPTYTLPGWGLFQDLSMLAP
ncbi:hypothetical protein [Antarcticirhabdus aurantiaca]|uniref:Uncharacterized protein n=1 Tax=Antarcticirhabdus aurantiaca TaxID=2606717 RepID=A0ACD4NTK8_9HYPH|nr:hypothetical protein [Antarcticirhabdus aurantiaca]WAJ30093.1 hypothetical protein OXU80_07770 [Jeongeuplla avenae]